MFAVSEVRLFVEKSPASSDALVLYWYQVPGGISRQETARQLSLLSDDDLRLLVIVMDDPPAPEYLAGQVQGLLSQFPQAECLSVRLVFVLVSRYSAPVNLSSPVGWPRWTRVKDGAHLKVVDLALNIRSTLAQVRPQIEKAAAAVYELDSACCMRMHRRGSLGQLQPFPGAPVSGAEQLDGILRCIPDPSTYRPNAQRCGTLFDRLWFSLSANKSRSAVVALCRALGVALDADASRWQRPCASVLLDLPLDEREPHVRTGLAVAICITCIVRVRGAESHPDAGATAFPAALLARLVEDLEVSTRSLEGLLRNLQ